MLISVYIRKLSTDWTLMSALKEKISFEGEQTAARLQAILIDRFVFVLRQGSRK